jgi:UrcA family protein
MMIDYGKALAICGATLIGAVAVAAAAAPAHAQGPGRPAVVIGHPSDFAVRSVSYADLNLTSGSGRSELNHRVRAAVNDVCEAVVGTTDDHGLIACRWDAWGGAHPQVARAVQRAQEIAATGSSSIAAAAITIDVGE